jgi:hypothetical protein
MKQNRVCYEAKTIITNTERDSEGRRSRGKRETDRIYINGE